MRTIRMTLRTSILGAVDAKYFFEDAAEGGFVEGFFGAMKDDGDLEFLLNDFVGGFHFDGNVQLQIQEHDIAGLQGAALQCNCRGGGGSANSVVEPFELVPIVVQNFLIIFDDKDTSICHICITKNFFGPAQVSEPGVE